MELTPVESSHIAAIGYLEADRVLLVRYKDGSLYARLGWSSAAYESLMRASSKGKVLAVCTGPSVPITKGGNHAGVPSNAGGDPNAESEISRLGHSTLTNSGVASGECAAPLNVIDEDADKCCRKRLLAALASWSGDEQKYLYSWACPNCGTLFGPELIAGTRYWRIQAIVKIVRRQQ